MNDDNELSEYFPYRFEVLKDEISKSDLVREFATKNGLKVLELKSVYLDPRDLKLKED